MKTSRELRTAYHEAGHAVIAVHYSLPIERVSIVGDDETHGHVLSHNPLRNLNEYGSDPMRIERAMRRRFQFCVAGAEAVRLIAPRRAHDGTQDDYHTAGNCLLSLSSEESERNAWNTLLCAETRNLIARYRPAIEALAAALVERKTLSGKEVRAIVRHALRRLKFTV